MDRVRQAASNQGIKDLKRDVYISQKRKRFSKKVLFSTNERKLQRESFNGNKQVVYECLHQPGSVWDEEKALWQSSQQLFIGNQWKSWSSTSFYYEKQMLYIVSLSYIVIIKHFNISAVGWCNETEAYAFIILYFYTLSIISI